MNLNSKNRIYILYIVLIVAAALVVAFFVTWGLNTGNISYNLPRRLKKVAAIALTGSAIAVSSLAFQTITSNRILTPSVMGLDSLFLFVQTVVAFLFGAGTLSIMNSFVEFALCCVFMISFSLVLCTLVFIRPGQNLYVMILVGMVAGNFFSSLSSFMQALIDPNEYSVLQGKMFASFNNVNTSLLSISAALMGLALAYILFTHRKLDVLALGRENAISLGINYSWDVFVYLMLISLMVAVSTALVGPITFLGVLVVNLARQIFRTFRHLHLALGASLLSMIALIGGQFMVERIFQFNTTVSVLVNFVGGIYFIFLLLKERNV